MLFEQLRQGRINPAKILNNFTDEEEHRKAAELFNTSLREEMSHEEKEKALNDMVMVVKKNSIDYLSRNVTDINQLQEVITLQRSLSKIRITL
jgi:DNA primase